jgi:ATP-dependent DNA helicase RecQ
VPLLEYFGESATAPVCGFCDNCLGTTTEEQKVDCTDAAREFLLCVKLTDQVFGPAHIVDVLRGSRGQKVLRFHHDRLACYGAGRGHSAAQWRHFAEQFVRQGLLEQDMEYGSLGLTSKGRDVLGGAQVFVTAQTSPGPGPAAQSDYDGLLFERLRALRCQVAEENDLPPYVVFSDRSLVEMATYYPQSESGFLAIHGVGDYKLKQHGERFLMVIRAYCAEHDLQERARPATSGDLRASSATGKNRSEEVGEQFAAGRSAADLQAIYGVTKNTIVNHLLRCVRAGRVFPPERIRELSALSAADQARVLEALADLGPDYLSPLFQALDGTVPYDELHIMRLVYQCAQRVLLP